MKRGGVANDFKNNNNNNNKREISFVYTNAWKMMVCPLLEGGQVYARRKQQHKQILIFLKEMLKVYNISSIMTLICTCMHVRISKYLLCKLMFGEDIRSQPTLLSIHTYAYVAWMGCWNMLGNLCVCICVCVFTAC